jgi:RNA polymerase sigma factor (sigma-70 family)
VTQKATDGLKAFDGCTLERLRAGDAATYSEVFAWLRARMIRVHLAAGMPSSADPSDSAQEALLRLIARIDSIAFATPAQLAKWLLVTAKHYLLDQARRDRQAVREGEPGFPDLLNTASPTVPNPERIAIAVAAAEQVLRGLSIAERQLLWNRLVIGLSYEEIASLLDDAQSTDSLERERRKNALRQEVFRLIAAIKRVVPEMTARRDCEAGEAETEVRS